MTDTVEVLRDYIRREHGYQGPLDADVDLLEKQILDSFSVIQLVLFIQEHFGIEFEAEEVVRANLSTLTRMKSLIEAKHGSRAQS